MRAETSLRLFSFGSKRKAAGDSSEDSRSSERAKAGLRSGVKDEVHGGHMDGDSLVLSPALGGGRYPMRPAGDWVAEETDGSAYRLVFQPTDLLGRRSGGLMVSSNTVSRKVVEPILKREGATGILCVYTPDREVARSLFKAMCGEPVEFPQCSDVFEASFPNFRRGRPSGDGDPGPIVLFGECTGKDEEPDFDGDKVRRSDAQWGFHIESRRRYVLSPDLGGTELDMAEPKEGTFGNIPQGEFRALVFITEPSPDMPCLSLSRNRIPRDVALAICSDRTRVGILNVYTPDRRDAKALAKEAAECRVSDVGACESVLGMPYYPMTRGEGPRAVFGLPGKD